MAQLILVLVGARSGKSAFAQQLAQELGGRQVLYVATATAGDEEMQQRIERHRQERPSSWRTLEAPQNVGRAIVDHRSDVSAILVDCLTMLISNLLIDVKDSFATEIEARVMAEVQDLADCVERAPWHLIVVSNEVGMGLVPPYPLGRTYRDLLGRANQYLAHKADQVYLLIAGIPVLIRGSGLALGWSACARIRPIAC